jgi:fibro-slime domain-containing protein
MRRQPSRMWVGMTALALAGLAGTMSRPGSATAGSDPYAYLPDTLSLNAVIRDFKAKGTSGGHNDFQAFTGSTTVGLLNDTLDSEGKPTVKSLRGQLIGTEFQALIPDLANPGKTKWANMNPALFDASKGDKKGTLTAGGTGNGFTTIEGFGQWYRDVSGVNASKVVPLALKRQPNSNRYVFDSAVDEPYKSAGGFFPINGELYGNYANNSAGKMSNFHFTTEVETEFVYERGTGQVFTFTGDDDVWVFIDGKLVIDLGGVHAKKQQSLELDRLSWLQDQKLCTLKVFHAERRTVESNFRIETTLKLRKVDPPATTGVFD